MNEGQPSRQSIHYGFVFTQPQFLKLWLAQMLSSTAQNLLNFTLIILAFDLARGTHFENFAVGLLVLSYGIPSVILASLAGVYVDHWNRRRVLFCSNALRAVLVLGFFVWTHNLTEIFILSFAIAMVTQFFIPAEAASIPQLVPRKYLLEANSLFVLSFYATFIIGYSAAAPIIGSFGRQAPFYVAAVMFGLAAILTATLPDLKPPEQMRQRLRDVLHKTGRELQENWRTIATHHNLYSPILYLALVQAVLGMVLTLAPALAVALLAAPLTSVSQFLIIPAGAGMVAGVLLVNHFNHRATRGGIVRWSALIMATCLTLLGLTSHAGAFHHIFGSHQLTAVRWFVAALVLLLGIMNAMMSTSAQTMLQENSTNATRGKVFGALNMFMNLAAVLPVLVAATLADRFGVTQVILYLGIALLLFAITQLLRGLIYTAKA